MDVLYVFIIIILGFLIPIPYRIKDKLSKADTKTLRALWLLHISTCIFYYFYTRNGEGGDAWGYWYRAQLMSSDDFFNSFFNMQGSQFMIACNYIPANLMGMGYFANAIFFGFLGFIAFFFLYLICKNVIHYNSKFYKFKFFPFLLFLPSLHFWSSGVGKDTMLFLCISMVAYGFMHITRRFPLIVIGLLISFGIRPHITLILLISFGLAYVINTKITTPRRIFILIIILSASGLILPSVLNFVKMDELSVEQLEQFSTDKAAALSKSAGSAIDISSYSYPLKVLTFLYRPFFFDINGIPALVASFENLLLVFLSIRLMRSRFFMTFKAAPLVIQGLFLFFIIGALVFCLSLSNLGIILRQRNMFLPGLILFVLWSFSYRQELDLKRKGRYA